MSQKIALIASLLKPVDDTRLFEKLGKTIGQTTKYRVNIIGFETKNIPSDPLIDFHPLFSFKGWSWERWWAPWKFLIRCWQLKPQLLIVSTPELLLPAVIFKKLKGCDLWYDIQENYRRNIQYQSTYKPWVKPFLLFALDLVEGLTESSIDHFISAEKSYPKQLNLPAASTTVLENKYQPLKLEPVTPNPVTTFAFTGTLAPGYGLLETIELIQHWGKIGHPVALEVCGVIRDDAFKNEVLRAVQGSPHIKLDMQSKPVPHQKIMEVLNACDFGVIAHQPNPSNDLCIPTRMFELLALNKPFLLQKNPYWEALAQPYPAAIVVDFKNLDASKLWHDLQQTEFYSTVPGKKVLWESEAQKLIKLL